MLGKFTDTTINFIIKIELFRAIDHVHQRGLEIFILSLDNIIPGSKIAHDFWLIWASLYV